MEYKLIAADIDGTLVDSRKELSAATEAAVRAAQDKGALFTISTGRTIQGLRKYIHLVSPGAPVVTYNGAIVLLPDTGEVLFEQGLEPAAAEEIIRMGMEEGSSLTIWSRGRLYSPRTDERVEKYRRIYDTECLPVTDAAALAAAGVTKIMWLDEPERTRRQQRDFEREGVSCLISEPGYLEFIDASVSKAVGLRKAAEYLGIGRGEIMALGDSYNDTDMLIWAGLGVAMGNAEAEVKEAADHVTSDNENDGAARAIERFILS